MPNQSLQAAMSENKEEILANFQSISGIDDVGEAFSHLEETNWDLTAAVQRVIPQTSWEQQESSNVNVDIPPPPPAAPPKMFESLNNLSAAGAGTSSNPQRRSTDIASTSNDANIINLTSDIDLGSSRRNDAQNNIIFNIHFNHEIFTIILPTSATIEQLKREIADATNVPMCRQALRGWPPEKLSDAQKPTTRLSSLGLSQENELILIDMTEDGFMDFENEEVTRRFDDTFTLTIVEQPGGRQTQLKLNGRTTVQEVKQNLYYITDIAVRNQEWTGWPSGCDNYTTLAQSGIELSHNFIVENIAERQQQEQQQANNSKPATNARQNALPNDTDSSADEFEDASEFNGSEEFFTDSPPPVVPPSRHLIPNNIDNESSGSIQFLENYVQRFGEPHPAFYTGSLEDALKLACQKPARERKLLAIYLHHGESILTNVFCDHLMKHESIIQTFAQNYILYGWDLTFESNKHMFLSSITACVSNTASLTVRNIAVDKLPSILVIGKSRLSGQSSCEVLSVIHGNVGLDDLLSRLIDAAEIYTQHLQVEIREEDERAARHQVKAEQDYAYEQTLQADMAKEAAKRQKEAAIAAERQRLESEKAEEDARRESIRVVAEQSLPAEPPAEEKDVSKIRVRKPSGEFLERRFYPHNTLQDLLNFVAANGFLIDEYKLISTWPRRDLTTIDASQTLKSLKLYPQETVIVDER